MRRALLAAAVAGTLFLGPSASAQSPQDVEQAKGFFNAGAMAYKNGQFITAIRAFESANKIFPRPAIVFSLAQAHKRQYAIDSNPEHLHAAIQNYQAYLADVQVGGRRLDATQALGELRAMDTRGTSDAVPIKPAGPDPTLLMVMTQAEGAQLTIDGKAVKDAFSGTGTEVKPGKHRLKLAAPGYFDDERDVNAVDHTLLPLDVPLREKPARLTLEGISNADVTIDGRLVGTTPLHAPIDLTPGSHTVVVTKNGHVPFAQEIEVTRDQRKTLAYPMRTTGQRFLADTLLLSGGAAIVGGVVFTFIAGSQQHRMNVILDKRNTTNLRDPDVQDYHDAHANRDTWTTVAVVAYGVGVAALLSGAVFYFFDTPTVSVPARRVEEKPKSPAAPSHDPMDMTMVPVISPTFAGAAWALRF